VRASETVSNIFGTALAAALILSVLVSFLCRETSFIASTTLGTALTTLLIVSLTFGLLSRALST